MTQEIRQAGEPITLIGAGGALEYVPPPSVDTGIESLLWFANALSNLDSDAASKALDIYERFFFKEREERARLSFTRDFIQMAAGIPDLEIKNDKTADARGFKYKYADFSTALPKIQRHLAQFGFSIHHEFLQNSKENSVTVKAILSHIDGHSRATTLTGGVENLKNSHGASVLTDVQEVAKTSTYLKRQTTFAIVGIVGSDDDNDGAKIDPNKVTGGEAIKLFQLEKQHGLTPKDYGLDKWADATKDLYKEIISKFTV